MSATLPSRRFRAIWPVEDPDVSVVDLLDEAAADLKAVARRHGVHVVKASEPRMLPGRAVPGSGGAALVVVIDAVVVRYRDMPESAWRTEVAA